DLHGYAGELYVERDKREANIINPVFGAHHLRKGGQHARAAAFIEPIAYHCIHMGYYWIDIMHTLRRINFSKIDNDETRYWMYWHIGSLYMFMGDWEKAKSELSKALTVTSQQKHFYHVYNTLAILSRRKGEVILAKKFCQKSLNIAKNIGDDLVVSKIYNNLGNIYKNEGKLNLAIEFYQKSIDITGKIGDAYGMAITYGNLGSVYYSKSDYNNSEKYYKMALDITEKIGDIHGTSQWTMGLGLVYKDKGEWDRAIEFYQKSMDIKRKIGDAHGMAQTYGNLSLVYFDQKKYAESVRLMHEIFFLFAKLGAAAEVQQAGGILANFQEELGEGEFNNIAEPVLEQIFKQGVNWGRHTVVSAQEAREIWERVNKNQ
ncbi:tetratricopeptide repeat protein, partial [candidate division KSB1 bacterium]|nr:tetratricopeptide repeat protein [candidate division KSB1 bacterium]